MPTEASRLQALVDSCATRCRLIGGSVYALSAYYNFVAASRERLGARPQAGKPADAKQLEKQLGPPKSEAAPRGGLAARAA